MIMNKTLVHEKKSLLLLSEQVCGAIRLMEKFVDVGAHNCTRATLRTSFLASCVLAFWSTTFNLANMEEEVAGRTEAECEVQVPSPPSNLYPKYEHACKLGLMYISRNLTLCEESWYFLIYTEKCRIIYNVKFSICTYAYAFSYTPLRNLQNITSTGIRATWCPTATKNRRRKRKVEYPYIWKKRTRSTRISPKHEHGLNIRSRSRNLKVRRQKFSLWKEMMQDVLIIKRQVEAIHHSEKSASMASEE